MNEVNKLQAVSTAQSYTTIMAPDNNDASRAATIDASSKVNFSGYTHNGIDSNFTVAGWIRVVELPTGTRLDKLFWAEGQFGIGIDAAGQLRVWFGAFGSQETVLMATPGITDDEWHYLAVTSSQSPGGHGGLQIAIWLDGSKVAEGPVIVPQASSMPSHYILGSGQLEFAAWSIWSVTLTDDELNRPEFGPPSATSPQHHDLAAAFNFAKGPAFDESGNNLGIKAHPGRTYWPSLELNTNSVLIPDSEDNVTLFGNGCCIMGWVQLPEGENKQTLILAEAGGHKIWLYGNQGFVWLYLDDAWTKLEGIEPGTYVHFALEIRVSENFGTELVPWVNGANIKDHTASVPSALPAGNATFAMNKTGQPLFIQGLSVWNRLISIDQIQADMAGTEPIGADGLLAYYPLQHDFSNAVSGRAATAQNAQLVGVVGDPHHAQQIALALAKAERPRVPTEALLKFPTLDECLATNKVEEIAFDETDPAAGLPDHYSSTIAHLDTIEDLTGGQKANVFRSLHLGHALWKSGVKTGTIEHHFEDEQTVFVFHSLDGPVELLRLDEVLDPLTSWIITIITDVIAILGAAFGLMTEPGKLANVVRGIMAVLPTFRNALLHGLDQGRAGAGTTVVVVVGEFITAGLLWPMIKALVTGSWWSVLFTAASLFGQILLCIISGGAALAVKLALAAIAVAKLLYDMTQYPH